MLDRRRLGDRAPHGRALARLNPLEDTKVINLIYQGRTTAAHQKLLDGQTADGARVIRRAKGFSDYDVINGLVRAGWLEPRASGPRGGTRWFTTAAGAVAVQS